MIPANIWTSPATSVRIFVDGKGRKHDHYSMAKPLCGDFFTAKKNQKAIPSPPPQKKKTVATKRSKEFVNKLESTPDLKKSISLTATTFIKNRIGTRRRAWSNEGSFHTFKSFGWFSAAETIALSANCQKWVTIFQHAEKVDLTCEPKFTKASRWTLVCCRARG